MRAGGSDLEAKERPGLRFSRSWRAKFTSLESLDEHGEEEVRRFEEFVDGELGAMTGEQLCSGFCTDSSHSFSI